MKNPRKNTAPAAAFANLVHLTGPVQVALFNDILVAEITTGRWASVKTKDHALAFLTAGAIITPEGALPGLQFSTPKKNYNFNDSNWVGDAAVLERLQKVADAAAPGKAHAKKDIYFFLEDIKNTLKASAWAPAPVEVATPEVAKVDEVA